MTYTQFSVEEREMIQRGLWEKRSIRSIARDLGRSHTSILREINRNLPKEVRRYTPRLAHVRAQAKRKCRGRTKRLKTKEIRDYVVMHLKRRWSPEQIAGRIREDMSTRISHEAIYQFIYAQVHRNGYGWVMPGHEDLRGYLRRRRKRRIPHGARRYRRMPPTASISIDLRPPIVASRSRIGDWESDTVESRDHKPGINTLVERKTGLLFATHLSEKTSAATVRAICSRLQSVSPERRHTITFDNGPENTDPAAITAAVGIACYHAHPYHAWERGTNENTNGLIRDYYPKKTDFTMLSGTDIAYVERELNSRPRKRLGWKTPYEAWGGALGG